MEPRNGTSAASTETAPPLKVAADCANRLKK
jgi:hypothetical protein